jgi:multiple sugar transport system substrate-binding protein
MSEEILLLFNQMHGTLAPNLNLTVEMHYGDDPVWEGFQAQIVYAQPRGPHPHWPEISTAIQIAMQEVLIGAQTPEQAGIAAAATIAEIDARN